MRRIVFVLALISACAPTAQRQCHKSSKADGVGPDGELHYPEVCTAQTTPPPATRPAAPPAVAKTPHTPTKLDALRPDTPEPCRDYARDRCQANDGCDDAIKIANDLATKKRAYAQCMKLLAGR
ncbi:MAG: hypothetical protein JO257_23965 [Deltaproteobacteria bacterium]|nr:hypothetical protein [Deltaproteobacteria bacterium]